MQKYGQMDEAIGCFLKFYVVFSFRWRDTQIDKEIENYKVRNIVFTDRHIDGWMMGKRDKLSHIVTRKSSEIKGKKGRSCGLG